MSRLRSWHRHLDLLSSSLERAVPYPRVFATLSGSDLYGFPSEDGDFDLRASHVLPTRALFEAMLSRGGMDATPGLTLELLDRDAEPEMDVVSHDIAKFLRLALQANGYVLEQLLSPLVVESSSWHDELRAIAPGLVTRKLYHHYRGFLADQERLYAGDGRKRTKILLYRYRVALTGIHVLRSGRVEANLLALNEWYRSPRIAELIAAKTRGEQATVDDDGPYLAEIAALNDDLEEASTGTSLPAEIAPRTRDAITDFHHRCRLALGGQSAPETA